MELKDFTAVQLRLSELFKAYLPADVRIHAFSNLTVLLCPCDEESYQDTCATIISTLMPHMDDLNVRFAVSTPLHGLESLSSAFQHLRHLLHIVGDTGEGVIFARDETQSIAQEYSYSTTRFYEMLLRGEQDIALSLMNEDVRQLCQRSAANETEVQQLFFIYRHEVMRVHEELRRIMPASQNLPALPGYLPQLSVEEQFDRLRACCRALCECIGQSRLSERESLAGRLLAYIDSRLSDPTLCVRAVIDQFNISESTLRNLLGRTEGISFSEYVESHRMKYAKQLVQHGSIAVSQIPQQCGYASANTFYKAFKRYYGVSPSQMREQLLSGKDKEEK